jgi:hypothetical protein
MQEEPHSRYLEIDGRIFATSALALSYLYNLQDHEKRIVLPRGPLRSRLEASAWAFQRTLYEELVYDLEREFPISWDEEDAARLAAWKSRAPKTIARDQRKP